MKIFYVSVLVLYGVYSCAHTQVQKELVARTITSVYSLYNNAFKNYTNYVQDMLPNRILTLRESGLKSYSDQSMQLVDCIRALPEYKHEQETYAVKIQAYEHVIKDILTVLRISKYKFNTGLAVEQRELATIVQELLKLYSQSAIELERLAGIEEKVWQVKHNTTVYRDKQAQERLTRIVEALVGSTRKIDIAELFTVLRKKGPLS